MDRDVRRAVKLFAGRVERRLLQGAAVLPAALVRADRLYALAVEPGAEAEPAQHPHRIRSHVDSAANLGQLGGLLVEIDIKPGLAQCHRGSQPADAAANDPDLER